MSVRAISPMGFGACSLPAIPLKQGGGAPAGYTASTFNGIALTYNGKPVYDNLPNSSLSIRTA